MHDDQYDEGMRHCLKEVWQSELGLGLGGGWGYPLEQDEDAGHSDGNTPQEHGYVLSLYTYSCSCSYSCSYSCSFEGESYSCSYSCSFEGESCEADSETYFSEFYYDDEAFEVSNKKYVFL